MLAAIARQYAEQGFKLVRIPAGRKFPTHEGWESPGGYFETPDEAAAYFAEHSTSNMGVVLGQSGLCSLDIDNTEESRIVLSEFGVDIDELAATNGTIVGNPARFRVVFSVPPECVGMSRKALQWVDKENPARKHTVFEIRGGPVQDVLPPSIHPDTNRPYAWRTTPRQVGGLHPLPEGLVAMWLNWDVFKPQAEALCPWAPVAAPRPAPAAPAGPRDGESVIDAFDAAHSLTDMLARYGYQQRGKRWLSPHSKSKLPGVSILADGVRCYIHHASDPLSGDRPVDAFDLWCYNEHGGDVSKAIKAAARDLGIEAPKRERKAPPVPPAASRPEVPPGVDPDTGEIMDEAHPSPAVPANDNSETPDRREHLEAQNAGFSVLGYDRDKFYFFPHEKKQLAEMTRGDMTETGLYQLAPLEFWELNFPAKTGFDKSSAVNWLIRCAYAKGVFNPKRIRGRGCWRDDTRVVVHLGDALLVDGVPRQMTSIASKFLYQAEIPLPPLARVPMDSDEGERLLEVASLFRWTMPASAALLCGWIALAPVCGALRWRPHIWLTGGAGCGKTTILDKFVHLLMGDIDLYAQGNSSEAGLRQELRSDALPVLFDESEQNDDRETARMQAVLALVRQASSESGAKTFKGSVGGRSMQFNVRSMFCLASIQVGIKMQADRERLTVLALRPKHEDAGNAGAAAENWNKVRNELALLARDEDLPARLFRRSVDLLPVTLQNIDVFVDVATRHFGNARDGDQYGALMAGAWSLISTRVATPAEATEMIGRYEWAEYTENNHTDDATRALAALLEARIRAQNGVEYTVSELAAAAAGAKPESCQLAAMDANALLKRHGMKVIGIPYHPRLLVSNTSQAARDLVAGTPFEADLRGQLLRVPGVVRHDSVERFAGTVSKAVAIPAALFSED